MVLNLQWIWKDFSSCKYHQYNGTIIHGSCRRSRLIAVWWVPWYPMPCGHGTVGTVPSIIGTRCRHRYHRATENEQWSFLVVPHARMIPYVPVLETMIRNQDLTVGKAGMGFIALAIDLPDLSSF